MATQRFNYNDKFNLKDQKVGISSNTPEESLDVASGTLKGFDLQSNTGITTFSTYEGFQNKKTSYTENVTIDSGVSGTLSGEVVIGVGLTMSVGTGATSLDLTTSGQGSINTLKVSNTFNPPIGGTNDRPSAPQPGALYYNKDFKTIEYWDGNFWRQVDNTTRSGRGFYVGGFEPGIGHNEITYFNTSTRSNAVMFGDLQFNHYSTQGGCGNETRGLVQGTSEPVANDQKVDYFTMASSGNSQTFGELTAGRGYASGASSSTRGLCAGGYVSPANVNTIDYVEIMTLGDHVDFGDLSVIRNDCGACSSPVRAVFIGGGSAAPKANSKVIDCVIIASRGNAVDFGGVFGTSRDSTTSHSNHTRAITAVGNGDGAYATELASGGNSFYFADLREPNRENCFNTGNMVRGVITGGYPAYRMEMEEVMIASGGRAIEFGEAAFPAANGSSFSDSHGGLGGY